MYSNRISPKNAAIEIYNERFPDAKVIFLAGSVIRGEGTAHSDLDLVVVYESYLMLTEIASPTKDGPLRFLFTTRKRSIIFSPKWSAPRGSQHSPV